MTRHQQQQHSIDKCLLVKIGSSHRGQRPELELVCDSELQSEVSKVQIEVVFEQGAWANDNQPKVLTGRSCSLLLQPASTLHPVAIQDSLSSHSAQQKEAKVGDEEGSGGARLQVENHGQGATTR